MVSRGPTIACKCYTVIGLILKAEDHIAPIATLVPDVNKELLVLATGAGSVILSHVNEASFWLVKQFFNMTVAEPFKTWMVLETLISLVGLIFILILSTFV